MAEITDNAFEFYTGEDRVTFTITQPRIIHKPEKIAADYPTMCKIEHRNNDGSVFGHMSIKCLSIRRPSKVTD